MVGSYGEAGTTGEMEYTYRWEIGPNLAKLDHKNMYRPRKGVYKLPRAPMPTAS